MEFKKSNNYHQQALKVMPGGVNSPVRAFNSVGMNPIYIAKGAGSKLIDVDGNEYIDYVNSWGPLILGHGDASVIKFLQDTLANGTSFGAPTTLELDLANLVIECFSSIEMLRMTNSGTEAVMGAIRTARAFTGKNKIIKFNGCYHGHSDYLLVKAGSGATTLGVADSKGVPSSFVADTISLEYNNLKAVADAVQEHEGEIAAIILEPIAGNMGMVMPKQDFLSGLRKICDREAILLIFDEVMTGFRVAKGGCVELFKVIPDMVILGKIIGGGLPVGCFGGSMEIMQRLAPIGDVYQAGTLSGNPLAMSTGIATLRKIMEPDFHKSLNEKAKILTSSWQKEADKLSIPFYQLFCGGMLGMGFRKNPIKNYQEALSLDTNYFKLFFKEMLIRGIYLPPSMFEALFLSASHDDQDIEKTIKAFSDSISELAKRSIYPK
ncbi:MAG: glutamate-1-semialdehyde 2,1-aminomutase [SAR324 cluster bacterium]|nr:glutamate-1-semialdehyde 2,1-aminomutase [SAR324 cluster bacterium]